MKKELPKIYAETVDKDTNHVVAYTRSVENVDVPKESVKEERKWERTIEEKIRNIFNSVHYVYKMDVVIETEEGEMVKQVVGRNKNHIITMDNEQIPIDKIKDIYIKEKSSS